MHADTSKVENLAQGSSCKLKFAHGYSSSAMVTDEKLAKTNTQPYFPEWIRNEKKCYDIGTW
jgi:hypothetical protein